MDLQWNLCPFCGNQQVDPYKVDVVTAVTPPIPNHENEENTPPVKNKSADDTDAGLPSVPPADDSN
jgi:hypothetical protein